jgi:hypothetical protein
MHFSAVFHSLNFHDVSTAIVAIFMVILLQDYLLTYSLNVNVQVSHPYKTTGKITVLYILKFTSTKPSSQSEHHVKLLKYKPGGT